MRPASGSDSPAPCSMSFRAVLPTVTTSASSAPAARALRTTSGPIPRGSPRVTARRGRCATGLEPDVDVRRAAQLVDVMTDGELLAELGADLQLHILEVQVAFGVASRHLEHRELGAGRVGAYGHDGFESGRRVSGKEV